MPARSDPSYQTIVKAWLADDHPFWRRWQRAVAGVFYNRVPRRFRVMPIAHWSSRNLLAASSPLIALYYGSIGWATAYAAAAFLFVANVVVWFFGLAAESKPTVDDASSQVMVRVGDLLSAFKSGAVPATKRSSAISACLGIIEVQARRISKGDKGDISVSLVQYAGTSNSKMRILHRNPGNERATGGHEFDCTNLLGHHACQAGPAYRVVHNLRHFGRGLESPTQSTITYRSIFFFPLEVPLQGGGTRMKGFVSVDSRRPYAFYGNRSRELSVSCRAIIDHLKDMMRENG